MLMKLFSEYGSPIPPIYENVSRLLRVKQRTWYNVLTFRIEKLKAFKKYLKLDSSQISIVSAPVNRKWDSCLCLQGGFLSILIQCVDRVTLCLDRLILAFKNSCNINYL